MQLICTFVFAYAKSRFSGLFIDVLFVAGWESQLLESGFLAIFLCPLFSVSAIPRSTPTSMLGIYGYRWLIFRIMLGAVRCFVSNCAALARESVFGVSNQVQRKLGCTATEGG